jgi:peptidylprolyl isomerase
MVRTLALAPTLTFALAACPALAQADPPPPTPASIVAEAPVQQWRTIDPADLMVIDLAPTTGGEARRIVVQLLPPPLSQGWVGNIRTLARAHWWDGTSVYRVVDNWVAQWGDGEDERENPKPLPAGLRTVPESEYLHRTDAATTLAETCTGHASGRAYTCDNYAPTVFFRDGWPVGSNGTHDWPLHCYASVGVARDLSPDTGTGAELYAVIGQAPRQLDRNIAVVGRVIEGIAHLSTLPRGTAEAGVYATEAEHVPIVSVRLADEIAPADRPAYEYLDTAGTSFSDYVRVKQNRSDSFYIAAAGGSDICNLPVPVRAVPNSR